MALRERALQRKSNCMLLHIKWVCKQNPARGLQLKKALFPCFSACKYPNTTAIPTTEAAARENQMALKCCWWYLYNEFSTEGKQQLEAWFDLFVWIRLSSRHGAGEGYFPDPLPHSFWTLLEKSGVSSAPAEGMVTGELGTADCFTRVPFPYWGIGLPRDVRVCGLISCACNWPPFGRVDICSLTLDFNLNDWLLIS